MPVLPTPDKRAVLDALCTEEEREKGRGVKMDVRACAPNCPICATLTV